MAASEANQKDVREAGMPGEVKHGVLLTKVQDGFKRAQEIIF